MRAWHPTFTPRVCRAVANPLATNAVVVIVVINIPLCHSLSCASSEHQPTCAATLMPASSPPPPRAAVTPANAQLWLSTNTSLCLGLAPFTLPLPPLTPGYSRARAAATCGKESMRSRAWVYRAGARADGRNGCAAYLVRPLQAVWGVCRQDRVLPSLFQAGLHVMHPGMGCCARNPLFKGKGHSTDNGNISPLTSPAPAALLLWTSRSASSDSGPTMSWARRPVKHHAGVRCVKRRMSSIVACCV